MSAIADLTKITISGIFCSMGSEVVQPMPGTISEMAKLEEHLMQESGLIRIRANSHQDQTRQNRPNDSNEARRSSC